MRVPARLTGGAPVLVTTDAAGGVWRYALTLSAGLAERGQGVVLAVLGPAATTAQVQAAQRPGVRVVQTGLPLDWAAPDPAALAHASERLAALAALTGAGTVHLHAPALVGAAAWPVPVVAVTHSCVATWWDAVRGGVPPVEIRWRIDATAAGLRRAQLVIAPTVAHAADTVRLYGRLRIAVVHNGSVPAAVSAVREPSILTAGRLWDEGKGVAWLDRAAPQAGVPVRAAGPVQEPVQGPVQGPVGGTASFAHVQLLGTLDPDTMAHAYAQASVFASLPAYEPFGLAVLEAAQAGCALVLRDIPSARELWDGAALFVNSEPGLLPALHTALRYSGSLGAKAQIHAARYTADAMVDGTLALHRALVS